MTQCKIIVYKIVPIPSLVVHHGISLVWNVALSTFKRLSLQSSSSCDANQKNLTVPFHPPLPVYCGGHERNLSHTGNITLFSARSVGTSKKITSDPSSFVTNNDMDIMFLTEVWLHSVGVKANCAYLTYPTKLVRTLLSLLNRGCKL